MKTVITGEAPNSLEDRDLLDLWASVESEEAKLKDYRQRIEYELLKRLEARDAAEIFHPMIECKINVPSPSYDNGKLRSLCEMLDPEVIETAYTPQHEEKIVVEDKWDARIFKGWGRKYGADVGEVIQNATLSGGPNKVKLARKKD